MPLYRKAATVLVATLVAYGVLVATHAGEFWPFSIYPMFSQAGNPWSRALVREADVSDPPAWEGVSVNELPGRPYALAAHGVDPIDLANFVSKTERWNDRRVAGLRQMFSDQLAERSLVVLRARGQQRADDSVAVTFEPYVLLTPDTTLLNPHLPR